MPENRVAALRQPDEIGDPLTEILRSGARWLVQQAVEAEFAAFLARHADLDLPDGCQRVVRHGHDPARPIRAVAHRDVWRNRQAACFQIDKQLKGALSQDTARLMVFRLIMAAAKSLRRLQGQKSVAEDRSRCKVSRRN